MKKYALLFIVCVIGNVCMAPLFAQRDTLSILPKPVSVSLQKGYFSFNPRTATIAADQKCADIASFLASVFHHKYGYDLKNNSVNVLRSSVNTKAEIHCVLIKRRMYLLAMKGMI